MSEQKYQLRGTVVLNRDLPQKALKKDDIGTVVELYEPNSVEVEFVAGDGNTQALITLQVSDVRAVANYEIISVRSLSAA